MPYEEERDTVTKGELVRKRRPTDATDNCTWLSFASFRIEGASFTSWLVQSTVSKFLTRRWRPRLTTLVFPTLFSHQRSVNQAEERTPCCKLSDDSLLLRITSHTGIPLSTFPPRFRSFCFRSWRRRHARFLSWKKFDMTVDCNIKAILKLRIVKETFSWHFWGCSEIGIGILRVCTWETWGKRGEYFCLR